MAKQSMDLYNLSDKMGKKKGFSLDKYSYEIHLRYF